MFLLLIITSFSSCRRPGGLTIFARWTRRKIDRRGITSTYHSTPKANRQRCRSEILTAMAENQRISTNENDAERKAIALAWLFHLVGDIHQPLHTVQLFTVDYPHGDRGGNEICVRVTRAGQPMNLTQILGRRDYLKSESHPTTERSHGAPKPPGVSAEPA